MFSYDIYDHVIWAIRIPRSVLMIPGDFGVVRSGVPRDLGCVRVCVLLFRFPPKIKKNWILRYPK